MSWTTSSADMIESAWGIIANAGGGDWSKESIEWQEAAAAWRDRFHRHLDERPLIRGVLADREGR
jgi:hypothetical protein